MTGNIFTDALFDLAALVGFIFVCLIGIALLLMFGYMLGVILCTAARWTWNRIVLLIERRALSDKDGA